MNVSARTDSDLLFINFNQDYSCLSVGSKNGYKIYNCEPFGKCYARSEGGIGVVEMLFCTSLVALVGSGDQPALSPRRLQIINTKRQSIICELTFPTTILAVKLNRRRLIAVLEEQIYVYDISNMKLLHTIETPPNPTAICAMSPSSENCFIAYPTPASVSVPPAKPGAPLEIPATTDVMVFDANACEAINIIQAHKSPVSALAMNREGTMLATASDKGTVIRVFALPSAQKIAQFRRGAYPAKIHSITFNATSTLLLVSSDTDTVHIFRIADGRNNKKSAKKGASASQHASLGSPTLHHSDSFASSINSSSMVDADSMAESTVIDAGSRLAYAQRGQGHSPLSAAAASRAANGGSLRGSNGLTSASRGQAPFEGMLRKASWKGLVNSKLVGRAAQLMPDMLSEMWEPSRDFAFLKLPKSNIQSIAAMSSSAPQIMVVTSDGYFYQYSIDLDKGGECVLLKQDCLLDSAEELGAYAS
ncbi:autophagy protein [Coemansia thaxteri]|uniref:Autophagy-related protein 18 n=1 Tax=Coemansia thaxteri TaxID=2663907 RepID=A0A9W8EGG6_9FUNG|nr:autophagy protein [Coemansia thaxteri]KAJ2005527.1 autophagy protein [Coemansia thaxteri]KAJ2470977.1 autophagy protein [Coemansia sp. RSA 2322]KAJ2486541.1 autophagy protein [Coemansia sp. RSA 2320]